MTSSSRPLGAGETATIELDRVPGAELRPTRFADEWSRYPKIIPQYESLFRSWTPALEPSDFLGRRVLDAGCGTGRNSHWALQYDAREVVAFDVDAGTVALARRNLAADRRASVLQASINDQPFRTEFDLVLCIGVLHHLAEPERAMASLVGALRPGGTLALWVYAREGYTPLKLALNAVRRLTCKLPPPLVHALVYPLSLAAFAVSRCVPRDHAYGRHLRRSPFWHVHSILYDQLLPEIAHYWSRNQVLALAHGLPVEGLRLDLVNGGSWALSLRKLEEP